MEYEPNPKHKPLPSPGRRGSICPDEVNAPALLRQSQTTASSGDRRWATDGERAFCAQQHDSERDLLHGYPVAWTEVPPKLVQEWISSGLASRRAVRRERRSQ